MEFWGVEVPAGKPITVKPDDGCLIHVSHASLEKAKKGESALLYVTVDGKKLVIGTLAQGNIPQISFDLVFEKQFELSHSFESGSVHFVGYTAPNVDEGDDYSDPEEEEVEEEAVAVPTATVTTSGVSTVTTNGNSAVTSKADSKPKAKPAEVKPDEDEDEDDDESDEEDDDEEDDGSDSEKGMDVDEDDSDDDEEDDSEDEEETPKKPELPNKKRANESASKTPLSAKKAKPAEEKKGGHTATPHPAKKGGKSPVNANQSPKSGGQSSGGGSNKKQFNKGKQFGSNNKGKGKGKGRA